MATVDQRSPLHRRLKSKIRKSLAIGRLLGYDLRNVLRSRSGQGRKIGGRSMFFPVCFACSKHFELLRIALQSLSRWVLPIKEISIFVDKNDPLSAEQHRLLLLETRYPLKFQRTPYPMSPPGPRVVLNELHAFRRIAAEMCLRDYMLKFDSDVIFLSDSIFRFVSNAGADAIGTCVTAVHPTLQEKFMQGGSYFIAGAALQRVVDAWISNTGFSLLRRHPYISEDQFISALLRRNGANILYNTFIYSDAILAEAGIDDKTVASRLPAIPKTASVLHFEGNKVNMHRAAEKLFPDLLATLIPIRRNVAHN